MEKWRIREELLRIRERYIFEEGKFTGYRSHDRDVWDLERTCGKDITDIEKDVGILYGDT